MNFNKNKLINKTLDTYYETFSHTLDTADFVPAKFNSKICRYIFKNMKKAFKVIDKEDRVYQSSLKKKAKEKEKLLKKEQKKLKPKRNIFKIFSPIIKLIKKIFKVNKNKVSKTQKETNSNNNC